MTRPAIPNGKGGNDNKHKSLRRLLLKKTVQQINNMIEEQG